MSQTKPSRLGRGLSALLGDVDPSLTRATAPGESSDRSPDEDAGGGSASVTRLEPSPPRAPAEGVKTIPLEKLRRNPDQPRKRFDDKDLQELTDSIKEKGLIQPILVRPIRGLPDAYQIVAGERRWRAAQRAQLIEVPVVIRDLDDQEVLEISIIENVQRADLNAIEEARGYRALMEQFGHTQEDIAKVIGKSRSHVANTMRLLALPPRVRDMVYEGKLSAGHARAIATAPNAEELADKILEAGLTVREAETLARQAHEEAGGGAPRGGRPSSKDADTLALESAVAEALGLEVEIRPKGDGSGELRIRYGTLEQLDEVARRLKASAPSAGPKFGFGR